MASSWNGIGQKQKNGLNLASMRKKDMSKIKATDDEIVDQTQQVVQDPNSIQAKILELSTQIQRLEHWTLLEL